MEPGGQASNNRDAITDRVVVVVDTIEATSSSERHTKKYFEEDVEERLHHYHADRIACGGGSTEVVVTTATMAIADQKVSGALQETIEERHTSKCVVYKQQLDVVASSTTVASASDTVAAIISPLRPLLLLPTSEESDVPVCAAVAADQQQQPSDNTAPDRPPTTNSTQQTDKPLLRDSNTTDTIDGGMDSGRPDAERRHHADSKDLDDMEEMNNEADHNNMRRGQTGRKEDCIIAKDIGGGDGKPKDIGGEDVAGVSCGSSAVLESRRAALLDAMFQLHSEGVYVDAFISFENIKEEEVTKVDSNTNVLSSSNNDSQSNNNNTTQKQTTSEETATTTAPLCRSQISGPYLSICSRLQVLPRKNRPTTKPRASPGTNSSGGKTSGNSPTTADKRCDGNSECRETAATCIDGDGGDLLMLAVTNAYSTSPILFPLSSSTVELKLPEDDMCSDNYYYCSTSCCYDDEQLWKAHEGVVCLANAVSSFNIGTNLDTTTAENNVVVVGADAGGAHVPTGGVDGEKEKRRVDGKRGTAAWWRRRAEARGYVKVVSNKRQQLDSVVGRGAVKLSGRQCLVVPLLQVHTPRVLSPISSNGPVARGASGHGGIVGPSAGGSTPSKQGALEAYLRTLFKNAVSFGDENEDKELAVRSSLLLYCSSDDEKLTGYLNMCRVTSYLRELLSKALTSTNSDESPTAADQQHPVAAAGMGAERGKTNASPSGVAVGATTSTASGMSTTTAATSGLSDSLQSDGGDGRADQGHHLAASSSDDETGSTGSTSTDDGTGSFSQRRSDDEHCKRPRRVWSPNSRRSVGWRMADGERVFGSYIEVLCKMSTLKDKQPEGREMESVLSLQTTQEQIGEHAVVKEGEEEFGNNRTSRKFHLLGALKWAAAATLRDYERDGGADVRDMIACHMRTLRGKRLHCKSPTGYDGNMRVMREGSCYQKRRVVDTQRGGKVQQAVTIGRGYSGPIVVESVLVEALRLWALFGYCSKGLLWGQQQDHHDDKMVAASEDEMNARRLSAGGGQDSERVNNEKRPSGSERVVREATKWACEKLCINWAAPPVETDHSPSLLPQADRMGNDAASSWWSSVVDLQKRTVTPTGRWSDLGAVLLAALSIARGKGTAPCGGMDSPPDMTAAANWPAALLQDEERGATRTGDSRLAGQFNMQQQIRHAAAAAAASQGSRPLAALYPHITAAASAGSPMTSAPPALSNVLAADASTLAQLFGNRAPVTSTGQPKPAQADAAPPACPGGSAPPLGERKDDSSQRVFSMILQLCNSKSGLSEFSSQESEVFQELLNWYASLKSSTTTSQTPGSAPLAPPPTVPTNISRHPAFLTPVVPPQQIMPPDAVMPSSAHPPLPVAMPLESNGILGYPRGPPVTAGVAVSMQSSGGPGTQPLRRGGSMTPSGRLGEFPASSSIPPPPPPVPGRVGAQMHGTRHISATTTAAGSQSDCSFFGGSSSGSIFPATTSRHGDRRFQNIDGGRVPGLSPGHSLHMPHLLGHIAGGSSVGQRGARQQPLPPLLASPPCCVPPRHPPPPAPCHRMVPPFNNYPAYYDIAHPTMGVNQPSSGAPPGRAHSATVNTAVGWTPPVPPPPDRPTPHEVRASTCHLIMNPPPPAGAPPPANSLMKAAVAVDSTVAAAMRVGASVPPPPPPYPRPSSSRPLGIEIGGSMGSSAQVFTYMSPASPPSAQPAQTCPAAPATGRPGGQIVVCEGAGGGAGQPIMPRVTTKGDELLQRLAEAIVSGVSVPVPQPTSLDKSQEGDTAPPTSAFRLVDADKAAEICHTGKPRRPPQASLPHGSAPHLASERPAETNAGGEGARSRQHTSSSARAEMHSTWGGLSGGGTPVDTPALTEADLGAPLAAPVRELFQLYSRVDTLEQTRAASQLLDPSSSHRSAGAQPGDRRSEPPGNAAHEPAVESTIVSSRVPRSNSTNIATPVCSSPNGRDAPRPPPAPLTVRVGQPQRGGLLTQPRPVLTHNTRQQPRLRVQPAGTTSPPTSLETTAEPDNGAGGPRGDRCDPSTVETFHVCLPISTKPFMQVPLAVQQGGESYYSFAPPENGRVSDDMLGLRRILSCEYGVCQVLASCLHGRVATISNVPSYLQPIVARLFNRIIGHHLLPPSATDQSSRSERLSVKCVGIYQSYELQAHHRVPAAPPSKPQVGQDVNREEAPLPAYPYRYVTKLCVKSAADWNGPYTAFVTGLHHLETQLKLLQAAIKQKVDAPGLLHGGGREARGSADDYVDVQFRYDVAKKPRPGSGPYRAGALDDSVRVTVPIRSREWNHMTMLLECPDPRAIPFDATVEDKSGPGVLGSGHEAGEIGLVTLREEMSGSVQGADIKKCLADEVARHACVADHLYVEEVRIETISGTQLPDPRESFSSLSEPVRCRAIPTDVYNSMARVTLQPLGKAAPRRGGSSPKHGRPQREVAPSASTGRGPFRGGKANIAQVNVAGTEKMAAVEITPKASSSGQTHSGARGVSHGDDTAGRNAESLVAEKSSTVETGGAVAIIEVSATQTVTAQTSSSQYAMIVTTVVSKSIKASATPQPVSSASCKAHDGSSAQSSIASQTSRANAAAAAIASGPLDGTATPKGAANHNAAKISRGSAPQPARPNKTVQSATVSSYPAGSDPNQKKQMAPARAGRAGRGRSTPRTGKESALAKPPATAGCTSSGVSSASPKSAIAQGVRREYIPIAEGHAGVLAGTLVYAPKATPIAAQQTGSETGRALTAVKKPCEQRTACGADPNGKDMGSKGQNVLSGGGPVANTGSNKCPITVKSERQVDKGGAAEDRRECSLGLSGSPKVEKNRNEGDDGKAKSGSKPATATACADTGAGQLPE
eukprot:GHVS01101378.1.p1 GENE.GHVS01101378.1~~GHVS01101378.1.p1  ORF type:complete len:2833 (+),score=471.28 GHVS01101378.1:453-8951(+)